VYGVKMRSVGLPMLAAALLLLVGGCSAPPTENTCVPGALSASPTQVEAGGTVTVSAAPASCAIEFTDGRRFTLDLGSVGSSDVLWTDEVPVAQDGTFSTVVHVPPHVPAGSAYVRVAGGYRFSCDDTGSCADDSVSIQIAEPSQRQPRQR
jgi:hypothetical protein